VNRHGLSEAAFPLFGVWASSIFLLILSGAVWREGIAFAVLLMAVGVAVMLLFFLRETVAALR
jgi:hypothetical protein